MNCHRERSEGPMHCHSDARISRLFSLVIPTSTSEEESAFVEGHGFSRAEKDQVGLRRRWGATVSGLRSRANAATLLLDRRRLARARLYFEVAGLNVIGTGRQRLYLSPDYPKSIYESYRENWDQLKEKLCSSHKNTEARKIMYFVATNHIEFFDPAITRSQRFDAVLFISPPSFDSKKRQLEKILREQYGLRRKLELRVTREDIEESLDTFKCANGEKDIPSEGVLAKFALLRFDELGELALNLKKVVQKGGMISKEVLSGALSEIHDARWRGPSEYSNYLRGPSFERLDLTKEHIWRIKGLPENLRSNYISKRHQKPVLVARVKGLSDISIPQHELVSLTHGRLRIVRASPVSPTRKKARRDRPKTKRRSGNKKK